MPRPYAFLGRLAVTYGLGVFGAMGALLIEFPLLPLTEHHVWASGAAIAVPALFQIPVIASAALLRRDHGLALSLWAIPAVLGTLLSNGIMQLMVIVAASGASI